jgi:hypothetical protein
LDEFEAEELVAAGDNAARGDGSPMTEIGGGLDGGNHMVGVGENSTGDHELAGMGAGMDYNSGREA